jgi:2-keto-3-deoxy-L-rhamnonate aldolase RhmA
VDVLFVGPRDLAAALGTDDLPLDAVLEAARAEGKSAGILVRSREELEQELERGFRFVGVGSDSYFLAQASAAAVP